MRKNATKLAALALTLAMTVTSVALPNSASAATKTVKLNTTSKTLYATGSSAKKTTTLKVTVNGKKKTATFKSSNTKVATVGKTSGKVTAKKAGKATITATYGGKKVKCKITVKAKFVKVTSVSVSPKTVSLAVGKTKTIKTTVKPSKASIKKVTYASDKKSVATVSSTGKITAKKAGTAKVTVTATDGTKKKATVTVKVTKATTPTATPSTEPTTAPTPTATPAQTATSASATAITSFKQTGAAKLTAEFSGAVSNTAKVEVTKDGRAVDGTVKFSDDKKSVVFEGKADFVTAEYTITVTDGDKKLTEKVKAEAAKISDIQIKGETALTGKMAGYGDNTAAYIYYDVVNQYGESMKESAEIEWTISSQDTMSVDKSTGRITIAKSKSGGGYEAYTYGTDIYVVGVNVKSGITVNKSIKVGMAQAIDKVEFQGFIDTKGDKTKFIDALPANFQKDRYALCYAALDQNNNKIEAVKYDTTDLTLLADQPLVVKSTFEASTPNTFTVGGVAYAAVMIQPGPYVDNGADVKFTMISNKTGTKSEKIFKVGVGAKLKSLVIEAPTDVVADGDKDVTLKYTAKDTNGNETKSYETIVRSTNELTLNASLGTLTVKETDSGEAEIKWSDKEDLAKDFATGSSYDNQSRIEAISTIVAGGESNNMTFNVSDTRRPVAFKQIKLNGDNNNAVVSGNSGKIDLIGSDDVEYLDQYGAKLDKEKAEAFFKQAATADGFNKKNYAIQVKSTGDTGSLTGFAGEKLYDINNDTINYTATLADSTGAAGETLVDKYNDAQADLADATKMLDLTKNVKTAQDNLATALNAVYLEAKNMPTAEEFTATADTDEKKQAVLKKAVKTAESVIAKIKKVCDETVNPKVNLFKAYGDAVAAATDVTFTPANYKSIGNDDVAKKITLVSAVDTVAMKTALTDTSGSSARKVAEEALAAAKVAANGTAAEAAAYGYAAGLLAKIDDIKTNINDGTSAGYQKSIKDYDNGVTAATTNYDNVKGAAKTAEDNLNAASGRANIVSKFAIVAKKTGEGDEKYTAVSKIDTEEYTVLPIKEVKDRLAITFNADKLHAYNTLSDKANGAAGGLTAATNGLDTAYYAPVLDFQSKNFNDKNIGEFTVKGTTSDGKTVTIPKAVYVADSSSQIAIGTLAATTGNPDGNTLDSANYTTNTDGTEVTKNAVSHIVADKMTYSDFYDFNTASIVRKDATAKLVLNIYGVKVAKSIAVSDAAPAAKEVKFTYKKKFADKGVVNPTDTKIATLTKTAKLDETDNLRYVVLDQYNCPVTDKTVSQTISDIKESETALNHLVGSFAPVQNGTNTASVDKAEIGDNYKLTVSVDGTNISGSVNVTVGADTSAYVSNKEKDADKKFRKDFLKMDRDN